MSSSISPSVAFEQRTNLPLITVATTDIILSSKTKKQLHNYRVRYKQKIITFNNDHVALPNQWITSTKSSFEPLIIHNGIGARLPKLTAGIKRPDEYYIDMSQKNAFIIEKKTQEVLGSTDEKIQAAAFKQLILRKKFNPD